ncbi:MAG: hypothetical protein KJP23_01830, partial [Deltaproteobacteria bacterium]|nr:hypothetical protein [Deltaproteobacteria bacterium]
AEKVYVYSASGSYLGLYNTTDSAGMAFFHIPAGDYRFRADHLNNQYWTDLKTLTAGEVNPINISVGGGNFTYTVLKSGAVPLGGVNCYLFDGQGHSLGLCGSTNSDGQVSFDLADGTYMFRVDYLGYQFWNDLLTLPGDLSAELTIEEETVAVTVTTGSGTVEGVKVYLFSESGAFLSRYGQTDVDGKVLFELPVGKNYQFRADIFSNPYWSDVFTVAGDGTNNVSIGAGGGNLQVTVQKDADRPMADIKTYLYNTSGSYLGLSKVTDASGTVDYDVPAGTYQVRADYLGYRFWSAEIPVSGDTADEITIAHQQMEIIVQGLFQGTDTALEGIKVYLFSPTDSYLSHYQFTNAAGKVFFDLPQQNYKVRADYLGQQFWSTLFNWQNTAVDIAMADAAISVTGAGLPQIGLKVYAYSATDSYLGLSETTNDQGQVRFRLPAGNYSFRVDYQGSRFWSEVEPLTVDLVNEVIVSVGGGSFALTVWQSDTDPLAGINCYVFSEGGSYLGLKGATGAAGQAFFDLANGSYQFRVDYLGYQHWSEVYQVPDTLSENMTIDHQDVVITVEGLYQTVEPLEGLNVYLFTPTGSYVGQKRITDINGRVIFNLPDQQFKVRVDYLAQQFWSEIFQTQSTTVAINRGHADVRVQRTGAEVADAKIYLFNEAGVYLGWYEYADASGRAGFVLPVGNYKFRIDESGQQHWSPLIEIIDGVETAVVIDLDN